MRAYKLRKKYLSEEHPKTASSMLNLGIAFQSLNKHDHALQYFNKCLDVRKKYYGDFHSKVATVYQNIGQVL